MSSPFLRGEAWNVIHAAAMTKPDPIDIYKNQSAILGWLSGLGHDTDATPDPHGPPLRPNPSVGFTPPTVRVLQSYNGKPCPFCGFVMMRGSRRFPTRDHLKPRHAGGTSDPNNCLVVCSPCNGDKGGKTLAQFAAWLERRSDPRAVLVRSLSPGDS